MTAGQAERLESKLEHGSTERTAAARALHNEYVDNISQGNRQPDSSRDNTGPDNKAKEYLWTVAVDLASNLRDQNDRITGAGAANQWNKIQSLSRQTAHKPVAFVVSFTHPQAESNSSFETAELSSPPTVDTFLLKDGSIKKLESHNSEGTAREIERLLQSAQEIAPSKHLGLIIDAHGSGTEMGIVGDYGRGPDSALRSSIRSGLAHRSQLDLLDFNSCLMSSATTLSYLHDLTKFIVASEDSEVAYMKAGFDSQNVTAALSGLLASPAMTPEEFARSFVEKARNGANGTPVDTPWDDRNMRSGTDTLAALRMDRFGEFDTALQKLGRSLLDAMQEPSQKTALQQAIDTTAAFPSSRPSYQDNLRDLQGFVQNILDGINQGKLKDKGSLKENAEQVLAAQQALLLDHWGSHGFFKGLGGLSVELPAASRQSRLLSAREFTSPGILIKQTRTYRDVQDQLWASGSRGMVASEMKTSGMAPEARSYYERMDRDLADLSESKTQSEYSRILRDVNSSSRQFLRTNSGKALVSKTEQEMRFPHIQNTLTDWSSFLRQISST
jgi:hypothetical protein